MKEERLMLSGDSDAQPSSPSLLAASWQATVILGALALILGVVVSFQPSGSLNVLAALLGILMILSGIFHLIRVFDQEELHRVWLGIAGLMFIVVGVILIRHLHLTRAIIGLIIGITWIVQGLAALIGGVVVASIPASSLNVLAVLLGIWFIIMGIFEIIGGLMLRRELRVTVMT